MYMSEKTSWFRLQDVRKHNYYGGQLFAFNNTKLLGPCDALSSSLIRYQLLAIKLRQTASCGIFICVLNGKFRIKRCFVVCVRKLAVRNRNCAHTDTCTNCLCTCTILINYSECLFLIEDDDFKVALSQSQFP